MENELEEMKKTLEENKKILEEMKELRARELNGGRGEAGIIPKIPDKEEEAKLRINKMLEPTGLHI